MAPGSSCWRHDMRSLMNIKGAGFALISAALFGASTPLAKLVVHDVGPLMVAGLLYLGAGVGIAAFGIEAGF